MHRHRRRKRKRAIALGLRPALILWFAEIRESGLRTMTGSWKKEVATERFTRKIYVALSAVWRDFYLGEEIAEVVQALTLQYKLRSLGTTYIDKRTIYICVCLNKIIIILLWSLFFKKTFSRLGINFRESITYVNSACFLSAYQ